MRTSLLAASALALAACGSVQVHPTGFKADPRPKDCDLVFLYRAPDRAFDELGDLESHVTAPPKAGALEVLRADACKLGADAVLVRKSQVLNELGHVLVAGTAIKLRPLGAAPAAPPSPEAPPPAAPSPPSPPATPAVPETPATPATDAQR